MDADNMISMSVMLDKYDIRVISIFAWIFVKHVIHRI